MYKKGLICFLLIATASLLMFSWLMPLTATDWYALDIRTFFLVNGWVSHNRFAQIFWSIANCRLFDLLPLSVIIFSVLAKDFFIEEDQIREKAVLFFVLILTMFIVRHIIGAIYGNVRFSPSSELNPAYLLTELVPGINSKDMATDSFPSDHGMIMLTWMGFMLVYARKYYKLLALIIGPLFCLPRLVSGAHWLTDVVVGSVFVALISVALVCFTPMGHFVVRQVTVLLRGLTKIRVC
jgi:Kdo2-lipid A phosphotransferase